ncbi:ABC transporter permease [bacterium 1XD42-1]|nr:ABC transporter permease [bacterium 1XD42-8]RKJ62444.1 ABC transporter permease [bacterium 1XD42-1]
MNDILFGNNNGAVIKKLSGRYFKASKSRNIIAIIAIVLTTILFTTIFTLGSGLMDTVHDQNIRKAGGEGQAVLNYISDEVYNDMVGNPLIDRIAYTKAISYRLNNPGLERWRADLWYMDDTALEFARYTPTTGHRPEGSNEIIADTKTLDALGVPAQIGETVSLIYEVKGQLYTTDFTLCGFWETDSLSNIGRLVVSKAFVDAHSDILTYTYPVDNDYSGVVSAYVMFSGTGNIEAQLHQLLSETGYACDTMGGSKEDGNYVIARVSPAYQSVALTDNPAMLVSGIVGVALIIVTGYLIIYNIFQISVIQDIQSYGQLKTLGTTKRQIKRLINRQALRLSLIGIPIGLLVGFFIGRALVPFLMNGTSYTADAGVKVTVNPLIFIGSAAFALFTVFVSVRKPAKIAGTVSAIEAIRYTENDTAAFGKHRAKDKKSTHGAKLHFMALANLGRNRKRTVLVIVSMTLSLVLFNTVFTLSSGFDIDKYIAKFMDTDFVISNADFFQYQVEKGEHDLSETFIEAVRQNSSFEDGGRLYSSWMLEEPFSTEHNAFFSYNKDLNGNPFVRLYGADDFLLNGLEVIEGTIDLEKLKTGEYILLSVDCNDDGTVIENPNISVGDTVRINHLKAEELSTTITDSYDFIIMAKVRANENTATTRNTGEARFYLPTEIFLPLCDNPHLVSFPFDVKEGTEAEMAEFLNSYIDSVEPSMDFESKATYTSSFDDLTSLIITIGGALSIIIGIIGIANFVNSVLTSVITRKKEFAMLQSIGMTGKQLKRMLSFEGLYYAVGTIITSVVLGVLFSVVVVRGISSGIWFFTYRFVMWPMLVIDPFLILLTVAIPALLYRQIAKASIIERLRQ